MNHYAARCGVCGREYTYEAEFMSSPFCYEDGRIRVNCPGAHTREEIVDAWHREGYPSDGGLPPALDTEKRGRER